MSFTESFEISEIVTLLIKSEIKKIQLDMDTWL